MFAKSRFALLTSFVLMSLIVLGVYAATRDELELDSDGYVGAGIKRLNILQQENGKWTMEAVFYHRGFVEDTRDDGEDLRYINFVGGAAFFKDNEIHAAVDRANIIRKRDDVNKPNNHRNIAHLAHEPDVCVVYEDIGPGDSRFWQGWTYIRLTDIETPAEWWIGGVTYASYDERANGFKNQTRAISKYDIDAAHEQLRRTNYFREDDWNITHRRQGVITPWP